MTTHLKSFLLPAAIAVLFACNEAPQANYLEDAPVVATRTILDGEEFIEVVYVSENYFLTQAPATMPCRLFDKQGRYLTYIGSFGQGPGEYRFLYAGQIDEPDGRIYLTDV
ncbi:MAG: 6-bladed beta-propeller [Tannerellaceae bacterium]|jgi:hypothetical protein|nr:6-bladed beta-propeller [Tannerellaceae bacterium]